MAYLEFAPAGGGALLDRPPVIPSLAPGIAMPRSFKPKLTDFTRLEWQVVDLAQRDRLSSINRPGPVVRAFRWAFGGVVKTALSDPRLEALRRIAVLSWYRGFSVAPAEVRAFLAAGFTLDQYETLLFRINAIRTNLPPELPPMNMITPISDDTTAQPLDGAAPGRPSAWQRAGWIVAPILFVGAGYGLVHRSAPAMAAPPPPTVTVATPLQRDVTEWDDYVGRFEPSRSVEVRPRVSGAVTAIHFTDGQTVRAGQPLFTIDPRPYAAALAEARAGVATATSDLTLARDDYDRASRLVDVDAVSKSEVDRLRARVQAATAALAAAQARVRARALDVEFTVVRAPISGRISDRKVDAGNLVAAGEGGNATLLTTINALDPIYFSFDGSEALFLKAKRAGAGNASPVEVKLQDEADYRWKGKLDFTDNGLDMKSGTIRGRAVLDNPNLFLTPGMFGNMRLASGGRSRALMVPDTAIVTDQARKTVLVVARDGSVAAKPVQLGPVVDGLRVIRGGLAPNDRVVIVGTQMAQPGTKVQTLAGKIAPVAPAAAAPSLAAPPAGQATLAQ